MKDASNKTQDTLISINRKTFIQVTVLLLVLMIVAIIITYLIPSGEFAVSPDGTVDYNSYVEKSEGKGIDLFHGLLAPIFVFVS